MKLAHYFLALYTILLSCIPCQDEVVSDLHDTANFTISLTDSRQQQSPDLCSPFCICACCSGITIQQHTSYLPESPGLFFLKEPDFMFTPQVSSTNPTTIWQPPRV